ncbi:MAG: histidine kinase [Chloroflexota bacterium]
MNVTNSRTDIFGRTWPAWSQPVGALVLGTAVAILWVLFIRAGSNFTLSTESLREFSLNPYFFGLAVQEILIPVGLVYLLSRTNLFRQAVTNKLTDADSLKLLLLLVGTQLLAFIFRFGLISFTREEATFGFFVVIVAGIVGGWRAGAIVGTVAMFGIGFVDYTIFSGDTTFLVNEYVEYYVVKSMGAVSAVWVGVFAGGAAEWLRKRRFEPLFVVLIGALSEIGVFLFIFTSSEWSGFYVERIVPITIITGLGMLAFALIVRSVQDEENRRLAEAARLELAETNLTLTQTQLALTQAELRALHAQINPHFFFNSLNTIRYFVRTNPQTARELLVNLSEIFQRALSAGEYVPLRDEISHVEAYLALEKARLDERLQIVWTNLANQYLDYPIPTLVLQPLVENAVTHGVAPLAEGGILHIAITRVGEDLLVQVEDNGPGFDVEAWRERVANGQPSPAPNPHLPEQSSNSIGLRNVDERLRMIYGEEHRLMIDSKKGEGTRIVFRVPIKE